jgi:hypothetical protein
MRALLLGLVALTLVGCASLPGTAPGPARPATPARKVAEIVAKYEAQLRPAIAADDACFAAMELSCIKATEVYKRRQDIGDASILLESDLAAARPVEASVAKLVDETITVAASTATTWRTFHACIQRTSDLSECEGEQSSNDAAWGKYRDLFPQWDPILARYGF